MGRWPTTQLVELAKDELAQLGLVAREKVERGFVTRVPLAYPMYDADYAERVDAIRGWLETLGNLQQVGRNGLHRYNNSDHSMLTAIRAVENIVNGADHDIWAVNAESVYHETDEDGRAALPPRAGDAGDARAAACRLGSGHWRPMHRSPPCPMDVSGTTARMDVVGLRWRASRNGLGSPDCGGTRKDSLKDGGGRESATALRRIDRSAAMRLAQPDGRSPRGAGRVSRMGSGRHLAQTAGGVADARNAAATRASLRSFDGRGPAAVRSRSHRRRGAPVLHVQPGAHLRAPAERRGLWHPCRTASSRRHDLVSGARP